MIPLMQNLELISPQEIYTVSRLNQDVKFLLEDHFPLIWVEGEISNFAAPHSGHWYFSLKDAAAQVRCALFKGSQRKLGFVPKDGSHVLIKARVSLYPNRGEYQLIAEYMEDRGEGKLRLAYELLKKKLEAAGLFNITHKKKLPSFPKQIGIVTSATGAAIRDILTVLNRRYPCVPIIIYSSLVQGKTAAATIAKAIQTANRRNECDVLIVARGGGSLEDLWPFNEELVAQALFESQIPVISGVGHEVDFTIADFVADVRAPTPSAAAEIVTPDRDELLQLFRQYADRKQRHMRQKLQAWKQQLIWLEKQLAQQHPKRQLTDKMQRLDRCEVALIQQQQRVLTRLETRLNNLSSQLDKHLPSYKLNQLTNQLSLLSSTLMHLIASEIKKQQASLAHMAAKLDGISPLATLGRGYAIVTRENHVLKHANNTHVGDQIRVTLMQGQLDCVIESIKH